jgi:hypothetical protein
VGGGIIVPFSFDLFLAAPLALLSGGLGVGIAVGIASGSLSAAATLGSGPGGGRRSSLVALRRRIAGGLFLQLSDAVRDGLGSAACICRLSKSGSYIWNSSSSSSSSSKPPAKKGAYLRFVALPFPIAFASA